MAPPPFKTELTNPDKLFTVNAILKAAGFALSARALLLLALIGSFALAVMAMAAESMIRIYIFAGFCVLVLLPLVYLEVRKRP